jgi:hypothetical protein
MSIIKCTYGIGNKKIDVTSIVLSKIKDEYITASNTNFGDPCYGMVKELVITMSDGTQSIVPESQNFYFRKELSTLPTNIRYKVYYHIFANAGSAILEIFEDQIKTIMECPSYDQIESVNCCLTGNDITNYGIISNKINELEKQSNGKIKIRKAQFGDSTYEKFTYYAIRDDVMSTATLDNIFIFYIHSKGIVQNTPQIKDWRKCMEYFLFTKIKSTISRILRENGESAGCFYRDNRINPKHYSGNFWVAKASFLRVLFSKHKMGNDGTHLPCVYNRSILTSDYYAGEFFLFKEPHKGIDLFPTPIGYSSYDHRLPLEKYKF